MGGAGLSGLPQDWRVDEETPMTLATEPTTALVRIHAKVMWRKEDQAGLRFVRTFDNHEIKIARMVHRLTASPRARTD